MTEDIERYIKTLELREDNNAKIFFDIVACVDNNDGNIMQNTLISVSSAKKNASGSDTFRKYAQFAEDNNYDYIEVTEYNSINGEPVDKKQIPIKRSKRASKVTSLSKSNNNSTFSGLGQVDSFLGLLGFDGGLGSVLQTTVENHKINYDLTRANSDNQKLENENEKLRNQIELLKGDKERLKEEIIDFKEQIRDLNRKHSDELSDMNQKLNIGSMLTNSFMGLFGNAIGINQPTQQSLQGVQNNKQNTQENNEQNTHHLQSINPESQKIIDYIEDYIEKQDLNHLQTIGGIIAFMEQGGDNNIITLANFINSQIQPMQNELNKVNNNFQGPEEDDDDDDENLGDDEIVDEDIELNGEEEEENE